MRITKRNRYGRRYTGWRLQSRRTRGQIRRLVRIWTAGAAVLLAVLLAGFFFLSRDGGRPRFRDGDLLVCVNGGGAVELYWPESVDPAMYQLELHCGETDVERYFSRAAARFSNLPAGEELRVQVRAVADGKSLFGKPRQVESWKSFKAKIVLPEDLEAPEVVGALKQDALSFSWTGEGELYEVFRAYEPATPGTAVSVPVASTTEKEFSLPLEEAGGSLRQFAIRSGWKRHGFILCGPASVPAEMTTVSADGMGLPAGEELSLTYQETSPRLCTLEWNGIQCSRFEVQQWTGEDWRTVARLIPEKHMRYDTGRLRSGSRCRFRVVAKDWNGGDIRAEEVSFYASVSTLYSTVWPIQNLTLYEDPGRGSRLASVPGGTSLCVLAEEGDWFRVRYGEEYGWVDSRFCLIDLPEYVGDHCAYDITNSYDSLFAVHGSPIREVTHQVLPGYEDVRMDDGTFLVPYLYPCAKKLLTAAQAAQADGLRLKIYEAFRPQQATRFSYDTTEKQLKDIALTDSGGQVSGSPTLYRLMTDNGRFNLGSFLAKSISAHNRGIAVDLTLEKLDGGAELEMQSTMHDLSWYSETYLNTLNAKLLAGYMTAVGMNGLSSEWWHFQDDGTRRAIGLNTYLDKGVSPEGWTQDDGGWRYRTAGGSYVKNAVMTVDGKSYTFDAEGYAVG